jgi:hypothetical protein
MKNPMADGLIRYLIKSRAGIHFTPKRKKDILNQDNRLCSCDKTESMNNIIDCCPPRAVLMTKKTQ